MRLTTTIVPMLFLVGISSAAYAAPRGKSDLPGRRIAYGVKWPNSPAEGTRPIETYAELADAKLGGYVELLPFVLPSPDQEDAGSCLFMSLTGIAEWWLARTNPELSRAHDGPIDLSERYLMNLSGQNEDAAQVANWRTDSIFLYNAAGHGVLNREYRFTKGWYVFDAGENPVASNASAAGAEFGATFNWIDQTSTIAPGSFVSLPRFEREVLFADPTSNQWNTGVMPSDIVERVKSKLRSRQAPVNVIYNHFGYWHSVYVVGFDDTMSSNGCKFVEGFDGYMPQEAADLRAQAAQTTDEKEKAALLARAHPKSSSTIFSARSVTRHRQD